MSIRRWGTKTRIATWTIVGFLVAGCWVIYTFVTPPESLMVSLREPVVRAALYLSCPVSYAGRYYPIKFWWVLLINAATYAVAGLILEVFRAKLKPGVVA